MERIDRQRVEEQMRRYATSWNAVADLMDLPRKTMNNYKSGQIPDRVRRRFFARILHLEPEVIWPHLRNKKRNQLKRRMR